MEPSIRRHRRLHQSPRRRARRHPLRRRPQSLVLVEGDYPLIRTLVLTAALAFAGAAAAQDPHAGHHPQAQASAPQSGIITVPSNGAMTQGSPERFTATFPHPMLLKTVTLTTEGQAPIVVTAPASPAAATVGVALPRLAPGTYAAAWTAEGADGHKMSGSISFMVH